MIHGCVTLDEVFAAAGMRAASLVPETSGYLALALGDATSRLPFAIEERQVMLTTEGNVGITKRGEILPPPQAAEGLRTILARLLSVATGTAMPSLSAAARPRPESDRGVEAVVGEIEAALIPVNRAAARRALARLARETIRAREQGRLKRASARPPAQPANPAEPQPAALESLLSDPIFVASPQPVVVAAAPIVAAAAPVEAAPVVAAPPPATVVAEETAPVPVVVAPPPAPVVAAPPPAPSVEMELLLAPVVVAPPPAPSVEMELLPAPVVAAPPPAPVVVAPVVAVEPPAVVVVTASVLAAPDRTGTEVTPPSPELHDFLDEPRPDPTPTVLGMGAVEIHEPDQHTTLDVVTEASPPELELAAAAPDEPEEPVAFEPEPEPTALPESTVLTQPTEDPALAFHRGAQAGALTPPFPFEVAPRALPIPEPLPQPPVQAVRPSAADVPEPRDTRPTRADDLLARFGASCIDEQGIRDAAACLRQIAGIDPTPPPPARVDVRLATPRPPPAPAATFSSDWETPETPRVRRRSSFSGAGLGLLLAGLVIGLGAGGAAMRFRPDLFAALLRAVAPASAPSPSPVARPVLAEKKEAPPPPAVTAVEPAAAAAPSFGERLGGTRAERGSPDRGSGQRAR